MRGIRRLAETGAVLVLACVAGLAQSEVVAAGDGGGSVAHMQVVFADPGKMLRLSGGLGPPKAWAYRARWGVEATGR